MAKIHLSIKCRRCAKYKTTKGSALCFDGKAICAKCLKNEQAIQQKLKGKK